LETDEAARGRAHAFAQWLLPIIKTLGAETGFEVASEAIQVLGGAGYVRDWPVEQLLRDGRVLSIFEGTSGMQGLDLLHRRLGRDQGRGLGAFIDAARADIAAAGEPDAGRLARVVEALERAASDLPGSEGADAAAYPLLQLAALAATGWIALRLTRQGGRLAAAGRIWLVDLEARAALAQAQIAAASARLAGFDELRRG
jgi:hypothetical protein